VTEPLRGPLASTGFWLKIGAQAWQRDLDAALRDLDLTTAQFSALAGVTWLTRSGRAPTQQEVADFTGADRMMTSRLLTLLEDRALVERQPDPNDARVRRVHATDRGRDLVRQSSARARAIDQAWFGDDITLRDQLIARFGDLADG
jgi:DNA-binding MarR family transcriptional regulator